MHKLFETELEYLKKIELEKDCICDAVEIHKDLLKIVNDKIPDETELYDLAELFKIFGDSTRIRILFVLFEAEVCVCDLAETLNMTQSAISHQLKILRQNKLVKARREGKSVFYSLADDHVYYIIEGDPFGNVKCKLSISSTIVEVLSANVKCNFPIGQVSVDALGGASSMVSAVMQVSSANYDSAEGVAGGYVSGANGISNSVKAMLPQSRVSGSTGTFVDCFKAMRLYIETHEVVDDDITHRGRPLCKQVQISTLSGYILVSDPDIAISGTAEENTRIKSYMANGFFYE